MRLTLDGRTPGALWARRCEVARRSYAPICRSAAVLCLAMSVVMVAEARTFELLLLMAILGGLETARDLWSAALPSRVGRPLRRERGRRRLGAALGS